MSNIHSSQRPSDLSNPLSIRPFIVAVVLLGQLATDLTARLPAKVLSRLTMPDFGRLSDHRLRDIGLERDWDGSIIPTVRG